MREILFRGRRADNSEWVSGFYHVDPEDGHFITYFDAKYFHGNMDEPPSQDIFKVSHQIIPETVGQFTGITDKAGIKIFEGDICELRYKTDIPTVTGIVEWAQLHTHFSLFSKQGGPYSLSMGGSLVEGVFVIGSIHDRL
jgi:hypothetical protein